MPIALGVEQTAHFSFTGISRQGKPQWRNSGRSHAVIAMSKRGLKSERRAKKEESKPKRSSAESKTSSPAEETLNLQQLQQRQRQQSQQLPVASQQVKAADDGAVEVGDRILPRILLFSGVPVFLGLVSLPGFAYLNNAMGIELPVWAVYIVSGLFFGLGLAGISYGIFSASWDPRREGSLSGIDEIKENVPVFLKKDKF